MKFTLEQLQDLGLTVDMRRIWGPRMCFKYKSILVDYHVPSGVFIVKDPKIVDNKFVSFKILYNGRVNSGEELINILNR